MDKSELARASGTRGPLGVVLALLLASPFVSLLHGGSAQRAAGAEESAAKVASVDRAASAPSDECAARFFEPFDGLAGGHVPDPPPAPSATIVAGGIDAKAGQVGVTITPPAGPSVADWGSRLASARSRLRGSFGMSVKIEALIATVPDPIDSGLGYHFDTALQALRLGVEEDRGTTEHFYRDRSWLPWDDRAGDAARRTSSEECRSTVPGLILFRGGDEDGPRVLALFLVGETPTTGVHLAAMVRALSTASALATTDPKVHGPKGAVPEATVRIVGPTFSGSVSSLRVALQAWDEDDHWQREVRVVTGSATGHSLAQLGAAVPARASWLPHYRDTSFQATTLPERAVACGYLSFLRRRLGVEAIPQRDSPIELLAGVAVLHESGTEFGATLDASPGAPAGCRLEAEIDVSFPVHVSALRDAYEDMDRASQGEPSASLGRQTSLKVSLREKRRPLDIEGEPSPKTTYAQDMALSNMLGEIAREGVHHVAIQATDIADAIFLARKIRDVAPDVRIAFFESDALLIHPEFRPYLRGSLVVSAYPFLGTDDFSPRTDASGDPAKHRHVAFENASAEGTFNAVLALRGLPREKLREYMFGGFDAPMPLWIATVAASGIVPVAVRPSLDCGGTIYGGPLSESGAALCSGSSAEHHAQEWKAFNTLRGARLNVDADVTPPRVWQFVFAAILLGFVLDWRHQRRVRASLASTPFPDRPLIAKDDLVLDRAIGRTKWLLYAAIRASVLAFALFYMSMIHWFSIRTFTAGSTGAASAVGVLWLAFAGTLASLWAAAFAVWLFAKDYVSFGRCVGAWSILARLVAAVRGPAAGAPEPATPASAAGASSIAEVPRAPASEMSPCESAGHDEALLWDRVSLPFGFARPDRSRIAAQTSFAQTRLLAFVASVLLFGFAAAAFYDVWTSADGALTNADGLSVPATTLFVLRSLPLLNGVSPATPSLLILACAYVWSVGRMARLRVAHGLSQLAPADGVADLVSTPIRAILYPSHTDGAPSDGGFTRIERALLNAIWRPCTGPDYFFALVVLIGLPYVLFWLKRPASLEGGAGTAVLACGLWLCATLIAATLLQLLQYWFALERLFKRITVHPLGRAFDRVESFVRESVDDQVSRSPSDTLRLVGCARQFEALIQASARRYRVALGSRAVEALAKSGAAVHDAAAKALARPETPCSAAGLGAAVLGAAREISRLLEAAWTGSRDPFADDQPELPPAGAAGDRGPGKPDGAAPPADDALAPVALRFTPDELAWLRDAQAFVATTVALLINRHVRQFRYFLYTLTACAMLLLLATTSYPFEPHRLLLTCNWVIIGTTVTSAFWIYVELDRNTLMSHVAGTPPGKLTLDGTLAVRAITWVAIPLLGVAAAQYPEVANALFRGLEPFAHSLK